MQIYQIPVVVYFVFTLLAIFIKTGKRDISGYLLSSRKLTIIPFTATLVTTAYGWILGTGELYYKYGYFAWFFLNLPYTIFSLVFALFFSKKLQKQHLITLPDLLAKHYNNQFATFASLFVLIMISPVMYILMAAQVIHFIWNLNMIVCICIATLLSVVYVIRGGFKAVVKTDTVHFVLMFGGFLLVFLLLLSKYGFSPVLQSQSLVQKPAENGNIWYILTWYLFATITMVDPNYHQRVHAAKNQAVAKKGMLLAVVCWLIFDFLAASVALYVFWLNPNIQNPAYVYLHIANDYLPDIVKGVFYVALLATIFSTSNSFFFTSALTLSKDIFQRNKQLTNVSINKLTGYTLILPSVLCVLFLIPYSNATVVSLFFDITPYVVSALLLPVVSTFFQKLKLSSKLVFIQSLIALLTTFFAKVFGSNINEVFYGFGVALLFQITVLTYKSNLFKPIANSNN